jgi:hypothetical protein
MDFASSIEHRNIRRAEANELQCHEAIIDMGVGMTRKLNQIDLYPGARKVIEERPDNLLGLLGVRKTRVHKIHAEYPNRLLLGQVLLIKEAGMNDDLRGWRPLLGLKSDPEPASIVTPL